MTESEFKPTLDQALFSHEEYNNWYSAATKKGLSGRVLECMREIAELAFKAGRENGLRDSKAVSYNTGYLEGSQEAEEELKKDKAYKALDALCTILESFPSDK